MIKIDTTSIFQNFTFFSMRAMTTIRAAIFRVSASGHLAAIEVIILPN